ncbi:hypothetical protein [Nonomuraea sp. bgisy101]|uniref:hypothetical protein n=1 Tax=Nonomuraea sp. bgisy101 TaxID=3413784 RepID=UPI003D74D068
MKFPMLPTCAPWCHELHNRPGSPCRRNIDEVSAIAGHPTEVEVNILRDGGRDFVQLLITDHSKSVDPEHVHYAVRLSPADAGVIGSTFAGLDLRGVIQLGTMMFEGTSFLSNQPCRFDWCRVDHQDLDSSPGHHRGDVVELTGLRLTRHLVEQEGTEPDKAWVRMQYQVEGVWLVEDLSPQEARDRAEFLEACHVSDVVEVSEAFRSAAADLGVNR